MGTAAARMLFLMIILRLGFKELMVSKPAERTLSDFAVLFSAVELALVAVIYPDQPLIYFLAPLTVLVSVYRLSMIFKRSEGVKQHTVPFSMAREAVYEEPGMPAAGRYASFSDYVSDCPPMALPLIENGKVRGDNLKKIGKTQLWLRRELRHFGYRDLRQVNYLTIDQTGNFFMDLKKFIPES